MQQQQQQQHHLTSASGEGGEGSEAGAAPAPALENGESAEPSMDLFSTRRPKDWKAGLSSGTKNIAKGALSGVAAAISMPILSAVEAASKTEDTTSKAVNGLVGFGKGLFLGIGLGVGLPIAGAVTGIMQITRGLVNTPDALVQQNDGKDWDSKRRVWYLYDLNAEAERVLKETEEEYADRLIREQKGEAGASSFASQREANAAARQAQASSSAPERAVKDRTYYDVLEVSTSATGSEIKKAYFKKARQLHPDKNLDDPQAKDKFQLVGTAYQILSNDELRAKYDVTGLSGVSDAPVMDSSAFFAVIFGSEKFESIVGQLRLAMMMELGENPLDPTSAAQAGGEESGKAAPLSPEDTSFKIDFRQGKREVQLAVNLAKKLDGGIAHDLAALRIEYAAQQRGGAGAATTSSAAEAAQEEVAPVSSVNPPREAEDFVHVTASKTMDAALLKEREGKLFDTFRKQLEEEAEELSKTPIGQALLGVVAYVYYEQGSNYLGFKHSVSAGLGFSGQTTHVLATQFQVVKSVYSAYQAQKKMEKESKAAAAATQGSDEAAAAPEPSAETASEGMASIIDTLWHISVVDIESTLRKSCKKLFKDSGVSLEQREARAEGLIFIAKVFREKSQTSEFGLKALKEDLKREMKSAEEAQKIREEHEKETQEKVRKEAEDAMRAQKIFNGTFTRDELQAMKPKELKEIMLARSLPTAGCTEKEDYVRAILHQQDANEVL